MGIQPGGSSLVHIGCVGIDICLQAEFNELLNIGILLWNTAYHAGLIPHQIIHDHMEQIADADEIGNIRVA